MEVGVVGFGEGVELPVEGRVSYGFVGVVVGVEVVREGGRGSIASWWRWTGSYFLISAAVASGATPNVS
jgi:hypothetical protein